MEVMSDKSKVIKRKIVFKSMTSTSYRPEDKCTTEKTNKYLSTGKISDFLQNDLHNDKFDQDQISFAHKVE